MVSTEQTKNDELKLPRWLENLFEALEVILEGAGFIFGIIFFLVIGRILCSLFGAIGFVITLFIGLAIFSN